MKRAIQEISAELFVKCLPLPEDLKIADVVFNKESNTIKIYGYSEEYFDEPEGNHALNKFIVKDDCKKMLRERFTEMLLFGYIS